ncbi:EamA family transporter [Micromonospora zhanjiangensis]|uniref:EamA family transporter n=1 Tax=Micromonospora zhanjiangensis TaxID=1522057 RepID=A0ABV8KS25_9ACTN
MTPAVVGAVLLAAVLHATWNALAKGVEDRVTLFGRNGVLSVVLAFPVLLWVPAPARPSWPWLVASVVVHLFYTLALVAAYRVGEFNQTYPIARGVGPLTVAVVAVLLLHERMSPATTAGVALIAGAIALLGLTPWRTVRDNRAAVLTAVLTGLAIATYTVIDGIGVRRSDSPAGYTLWLVGLQGIGLAVVAFAVRRRRGAPTLAAGRTRGSSWPPALAITVLSALAYGLVLWAQNRGALAAVAALRESSVIVAAVIGAVFFGESMGRLRIACGVGVAVGAVLLSLPAS